MKRALVIIDYQKDFVDGSCGFSRAVDIEENICRKITECRKSGYDIIFTHDTHFENNSVKGENSVLDFVREQKGWELYGRVKDLKLESDIVISKHTFASADLLSCLSDKQYDVVELAGVATEMCVIANAVIAQAALPESEIIIHSDCVAGSNRELECKAFDIMKNLNMKIY